MLKHPNIIKFHEIVWEETQVNLVYELCEGGTLQDCLPLETNHLIPIFQQIVSACTYADKKKILHRDIKPANILIKKGIAKVADWGFSRQLKPHQTTSSFIGSPAYMAPEVLDGR